MKYTLTLEQDGQPAVRYRRVGILRLLWWIIQELPSIGRVNAMAGSQTEFAYELTLKIQRHAEKDMSGDDAFLGWRET